MSEAKNALIRRRVLLGSAANYAGKVFTLVVWFLLTPFMLHHLGPTDYGLWVLVGSVSGYGSLLDLGIGGAVIKYVAEHKARGEILEARELVATALQLYVGLGAVAVAAGAVAAVLFPHVFTVPPHQRSLAAWLVFFSFASIGVALPSSTATAVLRGLHRWDVTNLLAIVGTTVSALATIVILTLGGGLLGLVLSGIVITVAMLLPAIWAVHRVAPEIPLTFRGGNRAQVRRVFSFSLSVFIVDVAGRVQMKTDEIVIGAVLPLRSVTPYSLARRLGDLPRILTDQFMKVLLPIASELSSENDSARLQTLYITSMRLTLAICMALGVTLCFLAAPLLGAWVGEQYRSYAYLVVILTAATIVDTSQWPAASVLQGMARHQPLAVMAVGSALANLGLSIVLAHRAGLGGVAVGTLIPTSVECLGLVMPYTMHVLGVGPDRMLKSAFLPALLPAIPAGLLLYLAGRYLNLSSLFTLGIVAAGGMAVYAVCYLMLGASDVERATWRGLAVQTLQVARVHRRP